MKNKFFMGADPEIFMLDKDNIPTSAIDIMPGTKENPHPISQEGHSVQVDNVLLEFNVPPAKDAEEMHNNIQFVLSWFMKNMPQGNKLHFVSSLEYPITELDCPKACEFGCDPDFNAWEEKENETPIIANKLLRSAGGHIHISYDGATMNKSFLLVKALDLYLGVPSVLYDPDKNRRLLYGKAGCFRFKDYSETASGVEYRTLSNFWINNLDTIHLVFKQVEKAFNYIENNDEITADSKLGKDIVQAINNSDAKLANEIIKQYNII